MITKYKIVRDGLRWILVREMIAEHDSWTVRDYCAGSLASLGPFSFTSMRPLAKRFWFRCSARWLLREFMRFDARNRFAR